MKEKNLRINHALYMTKIGRKATIRKLQMETKYLKIKTKENFYLYKKQ